MLRSEFDVADAVGSTSADSTGITELRAQHAALVLEHAREVANLKEALATRGLIGVAIGIVMERYELDQDSAFQFLVRMSQTHNVKLRLVAQEIITAANDKCHRLSDLGDA